MKIKCLSVPVFKTDLYGDCTNNGISNRFRKLLVACPYGNESFDSDEITPINFCMVEKRKLFGNEPAYTNIVPAMVDEDGKIVRRPGWWMHGGNIANTSDSRWSELKGHPYPLAIHDRRES